MVLITGASSGIGLACAQHLPLYGFRVHALSRTTSPLAIDVTSDASVRHAVATVLNNEGHIDAVINNAGTALAGAIGDTTSAEALAQFETNLFGVLRVCRSVLPLMRAQGSGYIVNIGSIGGLLAIPYQGLYSASKFALEGLTESLRLEVKPLGINVVLVEPGDHRTKLTANRRITAASTYAPRSTQAIARMANDEQHGPDPIRVARLINKILNTTNPRLRYTTGPMPQRAAVFLKRLAPYSLVEKIMHLYYR